ncbi:MAG TPA: dynamin family protein [Aeromicrobium sp.]|nr:dynamin family protein [Aeromicrobium sp.]
MPPENASVALLGALSKLLTETAAVSLRLDVPGVSEARETQLEVIDQLSDYVLPRLVQLDAPVVVVVGGSTGAGKSTLVNSLIGERVTESGVLRPTTRSPVLVHHPDDGDWFLPDRVLPDLQRASLTANPEYALRVVPSARVPRGLAILDAPDIDSIDEGNRKLAGQLLAAADLWLFVTSAARYADQVPWDYLKHAADRSTSLALVLDRTPPEAVTEVRGHLLRMMASRGLADSPLFTVREASTDRDGLLPPEEVEPVSSWLREIAADPLVRWTVMKRTLDGAIRHNVYRAHDVADALELQVEAATQLYGAADTIYDASLENAATALTNGSLLRGRLLTAWRDFEESGDVSDLAEKRRLRRRLAEGLTGRNQRARAVGDAAHAAVLSLLVVYSESAADAAARVWQESDAGRVLLAPTRGLDRPSQDLRHRLDRVVTEWQAGLTRALHDTGDRNRKLAQVLEHQAESLTAVLTVVSLNSRQGATSGRAALESLMGTQLDELVTQAHRALLRSVGEVFQGEKQRFLDLTDSPDTLLAARNTLREAAQQADYARHTDALDEGTLQ